VGLKNWKKKKKCVWLAPGQQQLPIVFFFFFFIQQECLGWKIIIFWVFLLWGTCACSVASTQLIRFPFFRIKNKNNPLHQNLDALTSFAFPLTPDEKIKICARLKIIWKKKNRKLRQMGRRKS
jgi:hypothetical protein